MSPFLLRPTDRLQRRESTQEQEQEEEKEGLRSQAGLQERIQVW